MNIVGKILVILNLLFALATGGFLVVDYATRKNWKDYAEAMKRHAEVADASAKSHSVQSKSQERDIKKINAELETEREKINEVVARFKAEVDQERLKAEEERMKVKEADLTAQQALTEAARIREENKKLLVVVQDREKKILDMQKDNTELRNVAKAEERLRQATQDRNEQLLEKIQELTRAKLETEKASEVIGLTDANRPNPPSVNVKGVIEKVDSKDASLVEISVGSDHGIKKYHTLEVFRLNPRPEYLGTIRVVDVHNHKAVARLMRTPYLAARGPLRAGDQVSSKLGN